MAVNIRIIVVTLAILACLLGLVCQAIADVDIVKEPIVRDRADSQDDTEEEELEEQYVLRAPEQVDRLEPIRRLWKTHPLIPLDEFQANDGEFLRNLVGEESPASFVLSFVASSAGCRKVSEALSIIANSYWNDRERRRSVSNSKIYFILANATKPSIAKLVKEFRVDKAPTTVLIPKGTSLPLPGQPFPEDWILDPLKQGSSEGIIEWIESIVADVRLPPLLDSTLGNPMSFIEENGPYIIVFQLGVIFAMNAHRLTTKPAWMFLSLLVYFLSVSGFIYCMLRGAGPFGYSEAHGFMLIYPDRGSQFLFEGLMIGVFNILVSGALVFGAYLSNGDDVVGRMEAWLDDQKYQPAILNTPRDREESYKKLYNTAKMCIGVGIIFALNIWVIFKRKAPWYSPFSF